MGRRGFLLSTALSLAVAIETTGRPKGHMAFQARPCGSHHSQGAHHAASCRRTRLYALSDAVGNAARVETNSDMHTDLQQADELQAVPINPLKYHGVGAKPHDKRASVACALSHVLDGISAVFSLACGSATLACMGILEWSTIAWLAVIIGYFTTAVGSLMVLATTAVGVLALVDTVRTPPGSGNKQAVVEEALQALAAPPRRLGSMSSIR